MRLFVTFRAFSVLTVFILGVAVMSAHSAESISGDYEIAYLYAEILPQRTQALNEIAGIVGADSTGYSALSQMGRYSASHFSGGGLPIRNLHSYGQQATAAMAALLPSLLSSHNGPDSPFPEESVAALLSAFARYDSSVRTEAALIIPSFAARASGQLELADLYYHSEAAYDFCQDFRIIAMMRNLPLNAEQKKPLPVIPQLPAGIAALRGVGNPFISSSDYSYAMIFDDIRGSQRQAMREFAKALDYQDAVAQNIEMQNMATDSFGLMETGGDEADSAVIGDTFNNIALLEFAMEKESLSEESKEIFRGALAMYKAAVNREASEVSKGAIVGQRTMEYGSDAYSAASNFRSGGVTGIFQGVRSLGRIGGRAAADVENAKAGRRLTRMSQRNQIFYMLWEKTAVRLGVGLPDASAPYTYAEASYGATPETMTEPGYETLSGDGTEVTTEYYAEPQVYVEPEPVYVEPAPARFMNRFNPFR